MCTNHCNYCFWIFFFNQSGYLVSSSVSGNRTVCHLHRQLCQWQRGPTRFDWNGWERQRPVQGNHCPIQCGGAGWGQQIYRCVCACMCVRERIIHYWRPSKSSWLWERCALPSSWFTPEPTAHISCESLSYGQCLSAKGALIERAGGLGGSAAAGERQLLAHSAVYYAESHREAQGRQSHISTQTCSMGQTFH